MSDYIYKAFISYRHTELDKKVAEKLQKMLEQYKVPKEMHNSKKNWRIFRDETELPTSNNLSDNIKSALSNSEFLIVLCSKTTAQSKWCMEEITQFKALHGGTNENIITLLVDGEPSEVFPKELCTTIEKYTAEDGTSVAREVTVEPLAANITADTPQKTLKKLNTEFLRIAAPLLGCGYDDLYNRNHRRRLKRFAVGVAIAFAATIMFGVYSSAMLMQINKQNKELRINSADMAAKTAEIELNNNNREGAIRTILDNRPYEDDNTKLLPSGMNVLSKAIYAYQSTSYPQPDRYLETISNIKYCEYNSDMTKLLAYDDEGYIYVWEISSGKLVFNDKSTGNIKSVVFLSDDSIIIVTTEIISVVNCDNANIYWIKKSEEIFNKTYASIENVRLSPDRTTLIAVHSGFDYNNDFSFINTQSGEILYNEIINLSNSRLCNNIGDFYNNSSFIVSYYTRPDNDYTKYNSKFLYFNVKDKNYKQIQYETDLNICALTHYSDNMFSIEGYRYNEPEKIEYRINTLAISGEEKYSIPITDLSQWFEDVKFGAMILDDENLSLLMVASYRDLIFVDILSGEIYAKIKFDSDIKKVYANQKNGEVRVLCEDGVYDLNLLTKICDRILYFDDNDSKATEFFLWGNQDKYAVVGKDKNNIVLYKKQIDENYTDEINISSWVLRLKTSKQGAFFTIEHGNEKICIYNAKSKEQLSEIPYAYEQFFYKDNIVTKDRQKLTWYDINTGEIIKSVDLDGNYTLMSAPDENSIIACNYHKILKITDDIQEVFSDDNISISLVHYINSDSSKIIADVSKYGETGYSYELWVIDIENGEHKVLAENNERFFDDSHDPSVAGKNTFAIYSDGKLKIFNLDRAELEREIPLGNIAVKKMIFSPDDRDIIIYGTNNVLYKYNVHSGELVNHLSLALNKNESSVSNITMDINKENNILILTRGSGRSWFIDLSSLEVITEIERGYEGCIYSTQEVIVSYGISDVMRFYPFYTSEQLIKMAEEVINADK